MPDPVQYQLLIQGPEDSQTFEIPFGTSLIGRQPDCEVVLNNSQVSRQHAELKLTEQGCWITDLGSANGTKVNGKKLTPNVAVLLAENAVIEIDSFRLNLKQLDAIEASISSKGESLPESEKRDKAPVEKTKIILPSTNGTNNPPPDGRIPDDNPAASGPIKPVAGLGASGAHLKQFLPGIYHTEKMEAFLGLFESILIPIEWNIDNFDLYLDPGTAPVSFLPWLVNWFGVSLGPTWDEYKIRTFLNEASKLVSRIGTPWALGRVLEIYTGKTPQIVDMAPDLPPFTFKVKLPMRTDEIDRASVERLINMFKPAFTNYSIEFEG